jgi:hypothetical protein
MSFRSADDLDRSIFALLIRFRLSEHEHRAHPLTGVTPPCWGEPGDC